MTTLNELEALARADDYSTMSKTVTVSKEALLQMIALIRQLGDALQNHGAPYLHHGTAWEAALTALKEFDK